MNRLVCEIGVVIRKFESTLPALFGRGPFPPHAPELAFAGTSSDVAPAPKPFSIKDFIGDGILWAVPKHRRSLERRMKRKYGIPEGILKILRVKTFLKVCDDCGHHYERGALCPHCYDKVRKETELIKEEIKKKLHLSPVDSEVVVLYDGEEVDKSEEYWKGKRIVEMKKPRPSWFSKNLLQKSTQQNSDSTQVKPEELG